MEFRAEVVAKGLGNAKQAAGGWVAPCPAHDDRNPSLSISDGKDGKVLVHCHAGCDQGAVVDALKRRGLWPETRKENAENFARPSQRAKKTIVATYDYADPYTGEIAFQVVRYEPKDFRQRCPDGKGGWSWSVPASKRILYNLQAVVASSKLVCIVEGEKDVEALSRIGVVATCNAGGAGKWRDNYSAALAGRDICILPDNDEPGRQHAQIVARALHGVAKSIRIVQLPGLAEKQDVSDWLAAGGSRDALRDLYRDAADYQPVADPVADPAPVEPDQGDIPFRPLGFNKGTYYYLALGTQQVVGLTAPAHTKGNLLGIAPLHYWEDRFPARNGFDPDVAANALMRLCERRGIFSPELLRGRGAWYDDGRVVLHLGDMLYADRTPVAPVAIRSRFVYEQGLPLRADIDNPLSAAEARQFVELVRMMPWDRDIDATYVAGWCALAHIGGVLNWRPHIWVVGGKGSGKSHVMSQVIRPVLGENCLFVVSETTEAGVRQSLGHDALPVLFDEAEGEDQRSTDRLQRILALVRQSSSETGGRIAKGTANGAAMSFQIRSCFAFSSINASLVQQSDKSRVTLVELKKDRIRYSLDELVAAEARVLTPDFISRFYARCIAMAPVIRKNATMFARAVAVVMNEQRAGDQIGALLAGAWSLENDGEVTFEQATEWVERQDWSEQREEVQGMSDEASLLEYLMQQIVKVDNGARVFERTIGELVDEADAADYDLAVASRRTLARIGMRVDDGALVVSNTSDQLRRLLKGTPWSTNWSKVLRRLPGAQAAGVVNFGYKGGHNRATRIPL